MKKSRVVIGGLVVLGAVCTSVAWYTGKQLPGVLEGTLAEANRELQGAFGTEVNGKVELLSLESGVFSSVARYRVTMDGGDDESMELEFIDHLEHGPFPWSRLKRGELMPVMAASNYSLVNTEHTRGWFAAAGDQVPLKGSLSLGYDESVHGRLDVAPVEVKDDDGSSLSFAGANLGLNAGPKGDALQFDLKMGRFAMNTVAEAPLVFEIKDLAMAGDLVKSVHGYYTGTMNADSAGASVAYGGDQALTLGKLEQRDVYKIEEGGLSLRQSWQVANINYAGHPIGDARVAWSMQRLDPAAVGSLVEWYEQHRIEVEALALSQSPELAARLMQDPVVDAAMQRVLAGGPRLSLEELSLKSASGESRLDLSVDLAAAGLTNVPLDQAFAQSVKALNANVKVSKPMIGDFAALKATLDGLDAESVRQASMSGQMAEMIALQSQMATVKGDDILMNLKYADGQVDFNGRKMTVDQFEAFVMGRAGILSGTPR